MAMRWKKDPAPTGLARVTAGPRGSELLIDGKTRVATVTAVGCRSGNGWFWVAGWGHPDIPHRNTCSTPDATEAEAKAAALSYVRGCLKQAMKPKPPLPRDAK